MNRTIKDATVKRYDADALRKRLKSEGAQVGLHIPRPRILTINYDV